MLNDKNVISTSSFSLNSYILAIKDESGFISLKVHLAALSHF